MSRQVGGKFEFAEKGQQVVDQLYRLRKTAFFCENGFREIFVILQPKYIRFMPIE
jgi:hypothetical protein